MVEKTALTRPSGSGPSPKEREEYKRRSYPGLVRLWLHLKYNKPTHADAQLLV